MSRKRRLFSGSFKAKVALAAIRQASTAAARGLVKGPRAARPLHLKQHQFLSNWRGPFQRSTLRT